MSRLLDALGIKGLGGLDETGEESSKYGGDNFLYNVLGLGKLFSGDGRYKLDPYGLGFGDGSAQPASEKYRIMNWEMTYIN